MHSFWNTLFFYLLLHAMEKFEGHILGCGSALPTTRHFASSQVINFRDKLFMIDCGEGTQMQMRKSKLKFSRLNHIFFSHLHGDHCFGLMGLLSTFGMVKRTATLYIHAPSELQALLQPQLDFFCKGMSYKIVFQAVDTYKRQIIYEDRSLLVHSIPLRHRIPCCGFLFEEKQSARHLIKEKIDLYRIPIYELNKIKNGEDFIDEEGRVIPNEEITLPASPTRKHAYCSDTIYQPGIVQQIKGIDTLYHEATFASSDEARAKETFHTTAMQAAELAKNAEVKKLIIGHFSARYEEESVLLEEAKQIFDNTYLAKENICFKV